MFVHCSKYLEQYIYLTDTALRLQSGIQRTNPASEGWSGEDVLLLTVIPPSQEPEAVTCYSCRRLCATDG